MTATYVCTIIRDIGGDFEATTAIVSCKSLDPCALRCNATIDEPVCVYNGGKYQLFKNNCFLLRSSCGTKSRDWEKRPDIECRGRKKQASNCQMDCPKTHDPVCGTDEIRSKIFRNRCYMNVTMCDIKKDLRE
ncbi:unnamed protein product [Hermetia illucens]|uniref:Kazal-like domain-containing protein n=1 Tax=Hermetia illucens TaxID=343691 RepID=A0A7R8UQ84_HERIL|nr:unnamed protein product [Hermetia illucens]